MWGRIQQRLWLLKHRGQKTRYDFQRMRRLDRAHNRELSSGNSKILILRDFNWGASYNEHFIDWVRSDHPDIARRIRLGRLPAFDIPTHDVSLLVPWLQDPLKELFPAEYRYAKKIEDRCRANGSQIVNPIDGLSVSIKSVALNRIRQAGMWTARVEPIDPKNPTPVLAKMEFPFFIRDDWLHGSPMHFVRSQEDLHKAPWSRWSHPIAVEFIDTRSTDGNYRKYRYYLFGDVGHNRHLIISQDWNVRAAARQMEQQYQDEESRFRDETNPHHDQFNHVRKQLGFDVVAFDYGFDQADKLVVWEPNPFPIYYNPDSKLKVAADVTTPFYRKLLNYLLQRAGIERVSG